jgi:mRNA interferase RelE/StbE
MAAYKIIFKKSVQKDFNIIPKKNLKKIFERIKALDEDPCPPRCQKLTGQQRYRLRQGRYRILYSIQDDELTVWHVKVGHRKNLSLTRTNQWTRQREDSGFT